MDEVKTMNGNDELVKIAKKQLFFNRISALCMAGMLAVLIVVVVILVPKVETTLGHINSVAQNVESSLDDINVMVKSITDSSENLNKLVDQNAQELTDAVTSISEIDFEGLNKAIQDLQDAVGPLASFFKKFN
ncbi:hypothetical protein [Butyrivibrio sp. YAB3001]|uniref:hypothetical protein n=1 Tax=Butyrivibrio sp. YAB3001 TaxID=1520812 RepID=UPI0008F681D0|nr:hypothetical protein [Butyrivibrio sp. YAB3001]SFC43813.1 hypothetical protein SAMN02910398_02275 [Butyrivibrio sp. YAB3001]